MNEQKLAEVKLDKAVLIDRQTYEAGSSVVELARLGRNERLAVEVLAAVLEVLGIQTKFVLPGYWSDADHSRRFPVLFAIDEAQALFQQTTYRSPDYSPLEAYSLSAPLLALDYLSGRKAFVCIFFPLWQNLTSASVSRSSPLRTIILHT